jgi:hypothetical protein
MRCLSPLLHNPQWVGTMKVQLNSAITKPARPSVSWETAEGLGPGRLDVNVIFTEPQATIAALKKAQSLARDLRACIQVRAAITVPYALPLDKPPVSADFIETLLSHLVCDLELDVFETKVHLYLCRDQVETLLQVLSPHSLVVIGGRKHWWASAERRVAKALRSKGHRVVFVRLKTGTKSSLQ